MASLTKSASASLVSLSTTASTSVTLQSSTSSFIPKTVVHVHSKGMRLVRFPVPSSELSVPIYTSGGELKYISRRAKKCKGDAVLLRVQGQNDKTHAEVADSSLFGNEAAQGIQVASTKYFFGINHDPEIEILNHTATILSSRRESEKDMELEATWLTKPPTNTTITPPIPETSATSFTFTSAWTSRTCTFTLGGKNFSWEHERTKLSSGEKARLLVLYYHVPPLTDGLTAEVEGHAAGKASQKSDVEKVKVAQLVRSDSTRTAGTKASYAGNGGVLEMGMLVGEGNEGEVCGWKGKEECVIDEVVVVATCLSMLKKEMDRRRALQTAVLVGAASS